MSHRFQACLKTKELNPDVPVLAPIVVSFGSDAILVWPQNEKLCLIWKFQGKIMIYIKI